MNRRIFVRATGTPTLRAATASPPEPKVQLPKRVRDSSQAPTTVRPSHQRTDTLRPYAGHTIEANSVCAKSNPGAASMLLMETPPVSLIVRPAFSPRSMKKVPSVMMKLGSFVLTTAMPLTNPTVEPERDADGDRRPDAPAFLRRQDSEQQAGAADHDAGREVELAADHEQRDRDGDDAVVGGRVQPARPDAEVGGPVDAAGGDREEDEDRDRAHERADVRPPEEAREEADARDALV